MLLVFCLCFSCTFSCQIQCEPSLVLHSPSPSLLLCAAISFRMDLDLHYLQSKLCYLPLVVMVLWKLQLITWTHRVLALNSARVSQPFFFFENLLIPNFSIEWNRQKKVWTVELLKLGKWVLQMSPNVVWSCSKAYIFNTRKALVVCKKKKKL